MHGHHIHAIHFAVGHAVGLRLLMDFFHRGSPLDGGAHAVAVVLADPEHRQIPDPSQVEGLVEKANVGGTVPEETDGDAVVALIAVG